MTDRPLIVVATLAVHRDRLDAFHAYERRAARIMRRHDGRLERAVVLEGEDAAGLHRELHIVRFATRAGYDAYRADPELAALSELRARSVVATEVTTGSEGPDYDGEAGPA